MRIDVEYKAVHSHVKNIINQIRHDQHEEDVETINREKIRAAKGFRILWLFPVFKKELTTEQATKSLNNRRDSFGSVRWKSMYAWGDLEKAKILLSGIEKAMESNLACSITLENEDIELLTRLDFLKDKDNSPVRY